MARGMGMGIRVGMAAGRHITDADRTALHLSEGRAVNPHRHYVIPETHRIQPTSTWKRIRRFLDGEVRELSTGFVARMLHRGTPDARVQIWMDPENEVRLAALGINPLRNDGLHGPTVTISGAAIPIQITRDRAAFRQAFRNVSVFGREPVTYNDEFPPVAIAMGAGIGGTTGQTAEASSGGTPAPAT